MKILLTYSPFCTPTTPPYSITNLLAFLKANSSHDFSLLDLNETFHTLEFPQEKEYYKQELQENYDKFTQKYNSKTMNCYSSNNKKIRLNEKPEHFDNILNLILMQKPDIVAFSVVYSSQAFYTYALIQELNKLNIETIIGGPAVNSKLKEIASKTLSDEIELINYIEGKEVTDLNYNYTLDYSSYNLNNYFTKDLVLPIKTSSTCYYKQCTFCSHYSTKKYEEYPISFIEKTIKQNTCTNYFIIDDMIHSKRLLELATLFKKYEISWSCQLKPTIDFSQDILSNLAASGLKFVMWGVESGNNRILNKICKGTNTTDIATVLDRSKRAGIINVAYIIFGFPTETKDEFIDTISFLKENSSNLDLISSAIFGLQAETKVFNNPDDYGISEITIQERTLLDPKVSYSVSEGLTNEEASKLRRQYLNELNKINKFPYSMNFFREHMFML